MERRASGGGGGLGLRHDPVLDFVREGGAWSPAFPTLEIYSKDACATKASDSYANDCLGTRQRPADRWKLTRDTPVRLPIQSLTLHFSHFLPRVVIDEAGCFDPGSLLPNSARCEVSFSSPKPRD